MIRLTRLLLKKSKRLGDEIKKKIKENDNKKYAHTPTDNTTFNFGEYNQRLMGNKYFTKDLTLDEAKKEQKKCKKVLMS